MCERIAEVLKMVSPCLHASMSPCLHVFMSSFSMYPSLCFRNSETENGIKENVTSVCWLQTENGNGKLLLFVCWKRKRSFVFLGRQTINDNQRLLFQQMCPSMIYTHAHLALVYCTVYTVLPFVEEEGKIWEFCVPLSFLVNKSASRSCLLYVWMTLHPNWTGWRSKLTLPALTSNSRKTY